MLQVLVLVMALIPWATKTVADNTSSPRGDPLPYGTKG